MDCHEDQASSSSQSSKSKLPPEFQDQGRAFNFPTVENPDEEGSIPLVQSNPSTTSTPCSGPHRDYDVFLSFRGEDTRKNFSDHLYNALRRAGIPTFRDEEELPRGTTISMELLRAIRRSKISIVVFSKDYASSSWCLDELVEILHCRKNMGHILLPIFYQVDPSDVRKQSGSFAEAFVQHERRFETETKRVRRWRAALTEAANCSGCDLQSLANGYESSFIEKIVAEVSHMVEPKELKVARHPVGMKYPVNTVVHLLNLGSMDVRMVGLYGVGGIGKTTLAKVVYNQICYGFEGSSCLLNIKQSSEKHEVVGLQKQLLQDILKIKDLKIANVDHGINLIEKRIYGKKVLIVLDDVDNPKQLYELLGSSKMFGLGSRVIATSRDRVILTNLGVNEYYKVQPLGEEESHQLFNLNAFNVGYPKEDYMELSIHAVQYCKGLPLALEVLGSSLFGRSVADWRMELEKLQRSPHPDIQKVLRISFDSLDDTTKIIFLDIACFFVGENKDYVIKILEGCYSSIDGSINTLIQRSLLANDPFDPFGLFDIVDQRKKLKMHDLIRDMGRQIVKEESLIYPEKRSRLWFHEEILNVLQNYTGTKTVEGIISNLSIFENGHLETKAFTNMKRLRLLKINGVHLTGSFEYLSKHLRLLCWHKCPLKFLPKNFYIENLVILDLQHSTIEEVWKNNKKLNKLKVLNLKDCKQLKKLPDFSQVQQLEILILEGCIRLVRIHESIGDLERLVSLNLGGCEKLRNLPSTISNLKFLEVLNLSGCLKLHKLPENLGNMIALKQLLADGTAIDRLPSSVALLKNLKTLQLDGCKEQSSESLWSRFLLWMSPKRLNPVSFLPDSVFGLRSLQTLIVSGRNLSEDGFPSDFGSLCSLTKLDLSRNNFHILPDCISDLPKLERLELNECKLLQIISGLPVSCFMLEATGCTSMERLVVSRSRKYGLFLLNCPKLTQIQGLEGVKSWAMIMMDWYSNLRYDFWRQIQYPSTLEDDQLRQICPPSRLEVPSCFSYQSNRRSISFHVPPVSEVENLRLLVCVVHNNTRPSNIWMIIRNKSRGCKCGYNAKSPIILQYRKHQVCLCQTPSIRNKLEIESGNEIEVSLMQSFEFTEVVKWGVRVLVLKPNGNEEHETMSTDGEMDLISDESRCRGIEHCDERMRAGSSHSLEDD